MRRTIRDRAHYCVRIRIFPCPCELQGFQERYERLGGRIRRGHEAEPGPVEWHCRESLERSTAIMQLEPKPIAYFGSL